MKLKPGEIICDRCKGIGFCPVEDRYRYIVCKKCTGKGRVDWIENIVGKKFNLKYYLGAMTNIQAKKLAEEIDKSIIIQILKESKKWISNLKTI